MVSTRRRQHDHPTQQKYAVGDKVEVLRVDGLAVGFLLSKANVDKKKKQRNSLQLSPKQTRSSASRARNSKENNNKAVTNDEKKDDENTNNMEWIVSVEGGTEAEEIISEQFLGRVLEEHGDIGGSDGSATLVTTTISETKTKSKKSVTPVKKNHTKGKQDKKKHDKTKVVVSPASSPTAMMTSTITTTDSATESMTSPSVKEPSPKKGTKNGTVVNKGSNKPSTTTGDNGSIIADWERKRPTPKPKKLEGKYRHVEQIHYSTGSLFLYRGGKHRRVEYIPRV